MAMNSTLLSGMLSVITGPSVSMVMLLLKATLILLVAMGITFGMQRTSAGARHLVWLVTLAALLLVPGLTAWAPISLPVLPAKAVVASSAPSTAPSSEPAQARLAPEPIATPTTAERIPTNASSASPVAIGDEISSSPLLSGLSVIFLVWALVVVAIASSLGYAAAMVRRIVNRARPLDSEDWLTPLWEVSDRLALEEPPRLLRSEDAKMPFACGVFNPTIVLPAECDTWSLDRRRAVLLHELAHVRRHDLVGHTLGRLACAVYWFHPLVWTAAKQLRSESERACDDLALACGARATDYAEHLLDIVTSVRHDATPSVALAMARRKEFEGRMLAILDPELRHVSPSRRQSAALIASLALISVIVGAAAPAPRAPVESSESGSPQPVAAPRVDLASERTQVDAKGYPDPREIVTRSNTQTMTSTTTSQRQRTITSQSDPIAGALGDVVAAAATAGVNAGLGVTRSTIMSLLGGKQTAGKDSDERPVLLARILTNDTSASLRRIAAWGLNEYAGNQAATEALANAVRHDRDASVREMAAWSLADAEHSQTAIDALVAAMRGDASTEVRSTAAWALGNIGDRSAAGALAAALSDASVEVRKRAAWALGNSDLKQAPPQLLSLLSDKDAEMRELAAWALYEIEDPASIAPLEAALAREQNKELQISYIRALAAVGEKSVDALKSLLESKDPEIRTIAVRALAGGHATGPWPRPWPEPRPYPEN
jgi:beta-lactamase regulating signal transducer with metallopeptidase domain/HEAT repeat protein